MAISSMSMPTRTLSLWLANGEMLALTRKSRLCLRERHIVIHRTGFRFKLDPRVFLTNALLEMRLRLTRYIRTRHDSEGSEARNKHVEAPANPQHSKEMPTSYNC